MRICCFGDSNTYGYDPCGFFGGRYSHPWPELLAQKTGFQVINDGMNGRMIPNRAVNLEAADLLLIMLGTNDLLNGATAKEATERMRAFLEQVGDRKVFLIAPPPMKRGAWVPDDGLVQESKSLSPRYRELAERRGISFADPGNVDLAYDGVHFTEEGHVQFASAIVKRLSTL